MNIMPLITFIVTTDLGLRSTKIEVIIKKVIAREIKKVTKLNGIKKTDKIMATIKTARKIISL